MKTQAKLIGHERIRGLLDQLIQRDMIPHALLIEGPEGVGKALIAQEFASKIAEPVDIHEYFPEGKTQTHPISNIKRLSEQVHLNSFGQGYRVFIVHHAEKMLASSSNALLKTFEEPPEKVCILLTSDQPMKLLPTIRSRCMSMHSSYLTKEELLEILKQRLGEDQDYSEVIEWSQGRVSKALSFYNEEFQKRREVHEQLSQIPIHYSLFKSLNEKLHTLYKKLPAEEQTHDQVKGVIQELLGFVEANFRQHQSTNRYFNLIDKQELIDESVDMGTRLDHSIEYLYLKMDWIQ